MSEAPQSGNLTPWSPAQIEAWYRRREVLERLGGEVKHPTEIAQERAAAAAERAKREEAERRTRWRDDPRQALRLAHAARVEAMSEVARQNDILGRAKAHLAVVQAEHDRAEQDESRKADEAAKVVALALEHDHDIVDEPDTLLNIVGVARQRRDRAQAAVALVERDLVAAETGLARVQHEVAEAAEATLVAGALAVADRISALEGELTILRRSLAGLNTLWIHSEPKPRPVRLPARLAAVYSKPSAPGAHIVWEATLKALIADPEAALPFSLTSPA